MDCVYPIYQNTNITKKTCCISPNRLFFACEVFFYASDENSHLRKIMLPKVWV